jgi:hypothetical protein
MYQVMTRPTQHQRFPASGDHQPLPERLSPFDIFEFPNVMNLKGTLPRFTVFALPRVETVNEFRSAEGKQQSVWRRINAVSARGRASEVLESEEAQNARPVLFRYGQDVPIVRFEPAGRLPDALTVLVGQGFEETGLPDVGQFAHAPFDVVGQSVVVGQPSQFCVVGKKDFCIRKSREFSSRGCSHRVVIPVAFGLTKPCECPWWDMQLDTF